MNGATERIFFVHGILPKPPPADHRAMLWRCLLDGIRRVDKKRASDLADHPEIFEFIAWSSLLYDEQTSVAPDMPGIERLLALPGPEPRDVSESKSWRTRTRQLVYLLSDALPVLIDLVANADMKKMIDDANRYFNDENGVAIQVRQRLSDALIAATAAGQRILLIGHSLGSVIAYDTLWELGNRPDRAVQIDQFLTIGSPLGVRFVRERLLSAGASGTQRYPSNIRSWLNLAAIGEMTALDRRMATDFAPMIDAGCVQAITDDVELINYFRGPDGLNVHKCYGYMANEKMGAAVVDWLSQR
jgi:hypothetical protein